MVTGSRVAQNGNQAPQPVTIVGEPALQKAATSNIADAVNQLPQLAGSQTSRTGTFAAGNGAAGANFLNLRGLGANRTLVLLDGRRVVPATVSGIVDANVIPSALVSRVDIVTGGASAAYGSDAVTGVVNFVLDTKFVGLKADVQSGVTEYGDDGQGRIELTGGIASSDGRAHLIASGFFSDNRGAFHPASRPWFHAPKVTPNDAYVAGNGQPRQLIAGNVGFNNAAQGGLITAGPLRGTTFDEQGRPVPFRYGALGGIYQSGGQDTDVSDLIPLDAALRQENFFSRASYEFSPAIEVFGEFSYGHATARSSTIPALKLGNLTISRDNAFLPAAVRDRMVALGLSSVPFGTTNENLGVLQPVNERRLYRGLVGAQGDLGGSWKWDAYYQYGRTRTENTVKNLLITSRFNKAIDARSVNGQLVCAVNADASTANDDSACVPLNVFGVNVASAAARNYVNGEANLRTNLSEHVAAATVRGQPLSLWAGPISIAAGAEYRREASFDGYADPLSLTNSYFAGNFKPTNGRFSVIEGFGEALIPLAKDLPFARDLDLNLAGRVTRYSISGTVTTWKAGLTWQPIEDLKLRATRSRDIRAPNISDLFLGGTLSSNQTVNDTVNGGSPTVGINVVTAGNRALTPERSDAWVVGAVLAPRFIGGLSVAVDYYDIKIGNTITALTSQQIVDRCAGGNAALCDAIGRDASGRITQINTSVVNLAEERGRGLDIEVNYRLPLSNLLAGAEGTVFTRAVGSYVFKRDTSDGVRTDSAKGENGVVTGVPRWRWLVDLGYTGKRLDLTGTMRAVSSGVYDASWSDGVDIDNNRIKGAAFFDLYGAVKVDAYKGAQFYLKIENILDRAPPQVAGFGGQPYTQYGASPAFYDVLGRTYRAGFRLRM